MSTFDVAGQTYRSTKMTAMEQFAVSRRLLPILATLKDIAKNDALEPMVMLEPMAQAIAQMPDDDCTFVLGKCLSVTQRKQPGDLGWQAVWNRQANAPQFDDIDMMGMLQITALVLKDNFAAFFPALPAGLTGGQ